jgi:hypothetical protein
LGSDLMERQRNHRPGPVETSPDNEIQYAFLSHIFGEKMVPLSAIKIHEDAEKSIKVADLEKTFQDVIVILRRLGIRYFWVDKLCIDWITPLVEELGGYQSREMNKLAQYVANAALVMNAGPYLDEQGIFHERPQARNLLELTCSVEQPFGGIKTGKLCFREPMRDAGWIYSHFVSSRAWIFQEITLPKRVLIFDSDQVYWKCHTNVQSEGNFATLMPEVDFPPGLVHRFRDDPLFSRWYHMVELFSSKEITFFNDRIKAIQGMAERTQEYLRVPAYRGALWEGDWHQGLLWYSIKHARACRPTEAEMPSWSWASLNGSVSYSLLRALVGISLDDPLSIEMSKWRDRDPESLEISGALSKVLEVNHKDQACQLLFDTLEDEDYWYEGHEYHAVLINRWSPGNSEEYFRWVGLLLGVRTGLGSYIKEWDRCGIVLGPWSNSEMGSWSRKTFHLAGDGMHSSRDGGLLGTYHIEDALVK